MAHLWIFGFIVLQIIQDAFPMESMRAREYVKLFLKNRRETNVASLVRIYCDVLIAHASLLVTQFFSVLRVFVDLLSQAFDLLLVVI
jgi:hypothetical protein